MLVQAKRLPNEPLDEVAANSISDNSRRHGQPKPSEIPIVRTGENREKGISRPTSLPVDEVELSFLLETLRRGQAAGSGLRLDGRNKRRKRVRR